MLGLAVLCVFLAAGVPFTRADAVTLKVASANAAADGYRIFMRRQGQGYDYNRPVWTGAAGTFTISDLEPGVTYFFVARAFKGDVQSPNSKEVSYTAVDRRPPKPAGTGLPNQ
jgi:hypothetical protein